MIDKVRQTPATREGSGPSTRKAGSPLRNAASHALTRVKKERTSVRSSVTVGSIVEIECAGVLEVWTIRAEGESDVDAGVLGADAPLSKALLGAEEGEIRTFRVGQRSWRIVCKRIRRAAP